MKAQLLAALLLMACQSWAQETLTVPDPYEARQVRDAFGRKIHYYITKNSGSKPRPLIVWIQGSGAYSHFLKRDGRAIETVRSLRIKVQEKALLVLVEKPGIRFLDEYRPLGTATSAPDEFRREHTLDRWSEAVAASLLDALTIPGVDKARVLVAGHSEGALVACRVAAEVPSVTHVAPLSSGGLTQLFSLMQLARLESETKVAEVLTGWQAVAKDPENFNSIWMGHPYRRWSSFLASSCLQELPKNPRAAIYMAHGTEDKASAIQASDALYASLLASGRSVTYERMEAADHGLQFKSQPDRNGLAEVFERISDWFALQ